MYIHSDKNSQGKVSHRPLVRSMRSNLSKVLSSHEGWFSDNTYDNKISDYDNNNEETRLENRHVDFRVPSTLRRYIPSTSLFSLVIYKSPVIKKKKNPCESPPDTVLTKWRRKCFLIDAGFHRLFTVSVVYGKPHIFRIMSRTYI